MVNKNKLASMLSDATNQYAGRTDILEGFCAFCALVGFASGGLDAAEIDKSISVIFKTKLIAGNFKIDQVTKTFKTMADRASSAPGRMDLWREFDEVADPVAKMQIVLSGIETALAGDGKIDEAEMKVLRKGAEKAGLNLDELLEV